MPDLPTVHIDIALPSDGRLPFAIWRYRNSREASLSRRVSFRKALRALRRIP